jgi:hypothetical protein
VPYMVKTCKGPSGLAEMLATASKINSGAGGERARGASPMLIMKGGAFSPGS